MLKNITLSAEDRLIEKARERAQRERKTLNAVFREWLLRYVVQEKAGGEYTHLMKKLKSVKAGRKFTRTEMNER